MKVLYLLNTTSMAGSNISFINLIKGLSQKNVECYIVYPDKTIDKKFEENLKPYTKEMYHVDLKSYYHSMNDSNLKKYIKNTYVYQWLKQYKENKELSKIVKALKPDIIHTNVGVIHAGYKVSKKFNIPHVWHIREYQTKDFSCEIEPSKSQFIQLLKQSYVIPITRDIQKYFQLENYLYSHVIYNGCLSKDDTTFVFPKKKYFLCSSRISPEKGHEDVIKAFSQVYKEYPDYKLLIAGFGNPNYIKKLKNLAQSLECLRGIEFLGFRNDISNLMDRATALIVASKFEGFGRMTAEAAFRGCLVIGHNTGGTKEILSQTGGLTYDGGVDDLKKKMLKAILYTEKDYRQLAEKAQKVAVTNFSNEQYVDKVFKLYNSILYK